VAKDRFHNVVRVALAKEGWVITHDPYEMRVGEVDFEIDLAAESLIGAERDQQLIAVEVKSFIGSSNVSDFHTALGQFMNYRFGLEEHEPERELFLAVPSLVYKTFFQRRFVTSVIQRSAIRLLVYDIQQEEIVQWL
jgi:XisH protein